MTSIHIHTTYTPEQRAMVEEYKSFAIRYMQINGENPSRRVDKPHPTIAGAHVFCEAWESMVPKLVDFENLFLAMMSTRQDRFRDAQNPQGDATPPPLA